MLDSDHPLRLTYQIKIGAHTINLLAPGAALHREGIHIAARAGEEMKLAELETWFDEAEAYVKKLIISIQNDGVHVQEWARDLEESGLIAGHNAIAIINAVLFRGREAIQVIGLGGDGATPKGPGGAAPGSAG